MNAIRADLSVYLSGNRLYTDGICLAEFKPVASINFKRKCAAADEMYDAIEIFVNQFIKTGNAIATTEQIQMFCAALSKARGELNEQHSTI